MLLVKIPSIPITQETQKIINFPKIFGDIPKFPILSLMGDEIPKLATLLRTLDFTHWQTWPHCVFVLFNLIVYTFSSY